MTPFPLIHIDGSPTQRGRMYGEAACTEIHRSLTFYTKSIIPAAGLSWGALCDDVMERVPRWAAAEPDLIEEAAGIAAGAGIELADVLALNTRGTFVQMGEEQHDVEPEEGCTSFAVLPEASRDGHMWTGQNWDYLKGIQESDRTCPYHSGSWATDVDDGRGRTAGQAWSQRERRSTPC